MNYGLAFPFLCERFENALICIISIGPSTELRPIFNFPIFRKNRASLEFLKIVFEYWILYFWWNKKKFEFFDLAPDSQYLQTTALNTLKARCFDVVWYTIPYSRTLKQDWKFLNTVEPVWRPPSGLEELAA